MKTRRLHIFLLFCFLSALSTKGQAAGGTETLTGRIRQAVENHFVRQFGVPANQLKLTFLRFPKNFAVGVPVNEIRVIEQHKRKRLGYQTVWVELKHNGNLLRKFPVSLQVAIEKEVLVAGEKIAFRRKITPQMFRKEVRLITEGWDRLITDATHLNGWEARRVIAPGTIITRDLFRPAPLVKRGDVVKVELKTGTLVISSKGIARGEGVQGETIPVTVEPGGKKLKARIAAPGVVCIDQENQL